MNLRLVPIASMIIVIICGELTTLSLMPSTNNFRTVDRRILVLFNWAGKLSNTKIVRTSFICVGMLVIVIKFWRCGSSMVKSRNLLFADDSINDGVESVLQPFFLIYWYRSRFFGTVFLACGWRVSAHYMAGSTKVTARVLYLGNDSSAWGAYMSQLRRLSLAEWCFLKTKFVTFLFSCKKGNLVFYW